MSLTRQSGIPSVVAARPNSCSVVGSRSAQPEKLIHIGWVKRGRPGRATRGNVASHELPASTDAEAAVTMRVTEHLLRVIYELPGLAPPVP
jgi:hypothetical protein